MFFLKRVKDVKKNWTVYYFIIFMHGHAVCLFLCNSIC